MDIPERARRVFSGVLHEVYQWDQELFDGSVATFEAIRMPQGVLVLAEQDGRIVYTQEEQPASGEFLMVPGGLVEPGEDVLAAAQRELAEEAGLESRDWEHCVTLDYGYKIASTIDVFCARRCTPTAQGQRLDPGERITVFRASFDDFLAVVADPRFRAKALSLFLLRAFYRDRCASLRARLFPGRAKV